MYKEHNVFETPPHDVVLWRYLDFTKFVSLLELHALFFARADRLGDPFEGSYSKANIELRPELYKGRIPDDTFKQLAKFSKELPRFTLISCWHESTHESAAMWRLYSRETDGIAIKTNSASFTKSFTCDEDIYIGRVKYVDYETDFIPEGQTFYPYLHKRKSFEHEREVRAMTRTIPLKDGKLDVSQDICETGKYYPIDVFLLVNEVVVAPYAPDWFLELVHSVAARYDLKASVTKSALADEPTWG